MSDEKALSFAKSPAHQKIDNFREKYGGPSLLLCAHASVLEVIRAETVALIRRNFFKGENQKRADFDADVLYGSLTKNIGSGYFEMDKEVRSLLIRALDEYGIRNSEPEYLSCQVARFIRYYIQWARENHANAKNTDSEIYLKDIEWVAVAYDEPDKAAGVIQALQEAEDKKRSIGSTKKVNLGKPASLLKLPLKSFSIELTGIEAADLARQGKFKKAYELIKPFEGLKVWFDSDSNLSYKERIDQYKKRPYSSPKKSRANKGEQTISQSEPPIVESDSNQSSINYENTLLHKAISSGNLDRVKDCLADLSTDVNAFGKNGKTPLRLAAELGLLEQVRLLVEAGANLNSQDGDGVIPLRAAIEYDQKEIFDFLINNKADPNAKSSRNSSPLMMAIYYARIEIFNALIDLGVDINVENDYSYNALDFAALSGNGFMFDVLLDLGARLNFTKEKEWPIICSSAQGGNPDIIKKVIGLGAGINSSTSDGWGPIHRAAHNNMIPALVILLELGASPNHYINDGWTALMIAAWKNFPDIIKQLLYFGANPNFYKANNYNALLIACYHANTEAIKALLFASNINCLHNTKNQKSPLILAIESKNDEKIDAIRALLADERIERNLVGDEDAATAIWLAYQKKEWEIFKALCEDPEVNKNLRFKNTTLLHECAINGYKEQLILLLKNGAYIEASNNQGKTPLVLAIEKNNIDLVDILLKEGAYPDGRLSKSNIIPVVTAVIKDNADILSLLIRYGVDLQYTDNSGQSLLHLAGVETVNILVDNGLDPNIKDAEGLTPLLYAIRLGKVEVSKKLVEVSNVNAYTQTGWTALHYAAQSNRLDIVTLLISSGAVIDFPADNPNFSPIQAAAEIGASEICQFLCKHGANINRCSSQSAPALILAIRNGKFETAIELIRLGAIIGRTDPQTNQTALQIFQNRTIFESRITVLDSVIVNSLHELLTEKQSPTGSVPSVKVEQSKESAISEDKQKPSVNLPIPEAKTKINHLEASSDSLGMGVFLSQLNFEKPENPISKPWILVKHSERTDMLDQIRPVDGKFKLFEDNVQVVSMSLHFYSNDTRLYRIRDKTWGSSRRALFYLKSGKGLYRLNGTSPPIHKVNKASIQLNVQNVLDYCRFFGFFVHGNEGPFHILENTSDLTLSSELSPKTRSAISGTVRPATLEGLDKEGYFLVDAVIAYSNAMFIANFSIEPSGKVNMLDDEPIAADLGVLIDAPLS